MATFWYSLRPSQLIKRAKAKGYPILANQYFMPLIQGMPEPASIIGDDYWTPSDKFWMVKVNAVNFKYITTNKKSPFIGLESKEAPNGKEITYQVPVGRIVGGKSKPIAIKFRSSGKLTKSKAGTAEQERGSAFIFSRVLNDNASFDKWQDIVGDDKTYPELVKIFKGNVPEDWLISYFAQQKVLLDKVKPKKFSQFNRDGGFMDFVSKFVAKKFNIKKKDNWDPADIWVIDGDERKYITEIKESLEGPHQTIGELNGIMRRMFKNKEVMGISLKKTGAIAYYEEVNLDGLIPDTKDYNYDVPMTDLKANFMIEAKTGMFTQDVKIMVDSIKDNKTFSFQIKALDSGKANQNLKFEPTMKGASSARLGKAPVADVVEILESINSRATFQNDYKKYPGTLMEFTTHPKGESYFRNEVLPAIIGGQKGISTDISNIDDIIANIKESYGSKMDRKANTRCKLMGLDFFYQISKLTKNQRNEFITDMVFLAQKKAFSKRPDFGPFGKIF